MRVLIKKILYFAIGISIVLPAILPLFVPYIPGTADGMAHKFRLVAFHDALNEGYIRPRWLGEVALGFGAPIFLFNYFLPYYLIDLIYRVTGLVNLSGQIYGAITLIGSFLAMFLVATKLWGKKAGIVAATVYTWAPYHLSSIYLYEGWGEMAGFIFPPLLLYLSVLLIDQSMLYFPEKYKISNIKYKKGKWKFIFCYMLNVICYLFFIFTHNVSVLMFSPVLIFLALTFKRGSRRPFLTVISAFFTASLLSAFFFLPAILLNNLTTYQQLIDDAIKWRWRFYKPLSDLTGKTMELFTAKQAHYEDFSLGLPLLFVGVIGAIWMIGVIRETGIKRKGTKEQLIFSLYVLFLLSLFFVNPASGIIWNTGILNWIVYPFRFLFLTVFAGSLLAGYFARKNYLIVILFIFTAFVSGRAYTKPYVDVFPWDDSYFRQPQTISNPPGTKKNMAIGEFLPKWENMDFLLKAQAEYYATKKVPQKFELNSESGMISQSRIRSEGITADLEMKKADYLTINTLYFPNWEAKIDGQKTSIYQDNVGRVQIRVPEGMHKLELNFGYSLIEKIGMGLSILGVITLIVLIRLI